MTAPLLTIGIPTWNRVRYASEAVDSLAAEVERHSLQGEVEILVSDNGSEDGTRAAMEERAARYPYLRYVRNERNMGVKFNVLQVLRLAGGRYSMMLGDDDRLAEGGLGAIVSKLRENPALPALFVQHAGHSYAFRDVERDTLLGFEEVYRRYFYDIGNAGVFVLEAAAARRVIEERGLEFFNDNWPQTQVICLSLAGRGPSLVSAIGAVNSELHESLSLYSSYYLWHVGFADLYTAARDMRPFLGEEFWREVRDRLCALATSTVNDVLFYASLVDTEEQRRRTAASIRRLLPLLPWRIRPRALLLWLHAGLPRAVVAPLYRARLRLFYGAAVVGAADDRARKQQEKRALAARERAVRENV